MSADDDTGSTEYWGDIRNARQQKRASNREDSAAILRREGIQFVAKNFDAHLIVQKPGDRAAVDFWPGTGRWIDRENGKRGFGVRNLIIYIKSQP